LQIAFAYKSEVMIQYHTHQRCVQVRGVIGSKNVSLSGFGLKATVHFQPDADEPQENFAPESVEPVSLRVPGPFLQKNKHCGK
jgi:hypothetical protein